MKIAIVDDQDEARQMIEEAIRSCMQKDLAMNCEMEAFISAEDLLCALELGKRYDLYFLDVEMPGKNGLELGEEIGKYYYHPFLVYVSNHAEYAPGAFDVDALHYITKDSILEKMPLVIEKIKEILVKESSQKYIVTKGKAMDVLPYREILYVESDGKYVRIISSKGEVRERTTIREIQQKLDGDVFMTVSRKCIVNLEHVMHLEPGKLVIRDGTELKVSRAKENDVMDHILKLNGMI